MLEPVRPEVVLPSRALCLLTFSHFSIVNKTKLLSRGKRVFITNVKGTFLGMSESEEASKRR